MWFLYRFLQIGVGFMVLLFLGGIIFEGGVGGFLAVAQLVALGVIIYGCIVACLYVLKHIVTGME